jgi:carbamoyl-phosphate synthase small subunit
VTPADTDSGYLLLEDGTRFEGEALSGPTPALGEAVFNTSHSGYQEILTDPSYHRQLMVFTVPHVGNVGINDEDDESGGVQAAGAVIRSLPPRPSNWRASGELAPWLAQAGRPLLVGADTRAITLHLRSRGAMRAGVFAAEVPQDRALSQVQASPAMSGADLPREVTCAEPWRFDPAGLSPEWHPPLAQGGGPRVVVLDFGVKRNILRELARRGCEVTVLPASTTAEQVLALSPHGVLASNGPGDPAAVGYGVQTLQGLLSAGLPLYGICLGHQLLCQAAGAQTFKLPFGHRGANHPVRREADGVVEITSQNHGFAVRPEGLGADWRVTHINLNDHTVEGIEHRSLPLFSLQYHPEASPGPHDALAREFDRFVSEMSRAQG